MAELIFKDNVEEGLGRLLSQWEDSPHIQNLVKSYLEQLQELEDVFQQLNNERSVFTAIGTQLDNIGLIVGEARNNRLDGPYRIAILNRIAVNNSDGTPDNIIKIMQALTQVSDVRLYEYFSGHYFIYVGDLVSTDFIEVLRGISPAGVSSTLLVYGGSDCLECAHSSEVLQTNSYLPHSSESQVINSLAREHTLVLEAFNMQTGEPNAQAGEPLAQAINPV